VGALSATGPGEYVFDGDRKRVRCPWHGWEYDLESGQSSCDVHSRVRSYDVAVQGGAALIDQMGPDGRVIGPYVAETFTISVEGDYLVLEL
jgi:3-phenylpropionate/trans-cinnamate dioxygenase ferredoxin subunit